MSLPDIRTCLGALRDQLASYPGIRDCHFIGIEAGGMLLASWLYKQLAIRGQLGSLNISFYRDDYATAGLKPKPNPSNIPFVINDADLILIDDILMTGRSTRAALNELFDFGRPRTVRLACLVDLGVHQLPIRPDMLGAKWQLPPDQRIELTRQGDSFSLRLIKAASTEQVL